MSRGATDHAVIVWMERDGEIYSPAMTLSQSSEEAVERDVWECAHDGVCHGIYRYGAHDNGGSYCRDITQDVAARLGRLSLSMRRKPAEPVRAFLETFAVEFFGKGEGMSEPALPAYPPFEMCPPLEREESSRTPTRRKSRSKRLDPEELRAQPQFKLPISGGKDADSSWEAATPNPPQNGPATLESGDDTGVERLSLKDERALPEQEAAWKRFDHKLHAMGVKTRSAAAPEEGERGASGGRGAFRA